LEELLADYNSVVKKAMGKVMDAAIKAPGPPKTPSKTKPNILVPDDKIISGKILLDTAFKTLAETDDVEGMSLIIRSLPALRTTAFFQEKYIKVSDIREVPAAEEEPTEPPDSEDTRNEKALERFKKNQLKVHLLC
jgi:hypothetical protein